MNKPSRDATDTGVPPVDGPLTRAKERQQAAWQAGKKVTVEELIAAFPELKMDSESVLNLVFLEILHRDSCHESPTLAEYRKRFPSLGDRLAKMFPK